MNILIGLIQKLKLQISSMKVVVHTTHFIRKTMSSSDSRLILIGKIEYPFGVIYSIHKTFASSDTDVEQCRRRLTTANGSIKIGIKVSVKEGDALAIRSHLRMCIGFDENCEHLVDYLS